MQGLGEAVRAVPQNCTSPDECSVHCSVGCKPGGKQDSVRAWLAKAAALGKLTVMTQASAERVVTESVTDGTKPAHCGSARKQQAAGVLVSLVRACYEAVLAAATMQHLHSMRWPHHLPVPACMPAKNNHKAACS